MFGRIRRLLSPRSPRFEWEVTPRAERHHYSLDVFDWTFTVMPVQYNAGFRFDWEAGLPSGHVVACGHNYPDAIAAQYAAEKWLVAALAYR